MRRLSNSLLIGSIGPGDHLTAACPDRKNIAEIERDPGRYQNKLYRGVKTVTPSIRYTHCVGAY